MVFFGREHTSLFADVPQAWVNGPVYPTIYALYKDKASPVPNSLGRSSGKGCCLTKNLRKRSGIWDECLFFVLFSWPV